MKSLSVLVLLLALSVLGASGNAGPSIQGLRGPTGRPARDHGKPLSKAFYGLVTFQQVISAIRMPYRRSGFFPGRA
jgi:hypothetical protein